MAERRPPVMPPAYGALGHGTTLVLLSVLRRGHATIGDIMLDVGRTRAPVHRSLRLLRHAGLVTWDRGREGTIRPTCGPATIPGYHDDEEVPHG